MRRKRFSPRRHRGGVKKGIIFGIIFAVLLPIGAIYIGLKITENWIVPVFDSRNLLEDNEQDTDFTFEEDDSEEKQDIETNLTETGEIKPLSIFTIQVASVVDKSNMENLINEMNNRKLSSLIYSVDNRFKVFAYGATKRTYVEEKLEEVRKSYPDAFISEMYLPKKTIRYKEDDKVAEEIINVINNIIEVLDKQAEEWYNNGGTMAYRELLNNHSELLSKLEEKIKEGKLPNNFNKSAMEKAIMYQKNNITSSLELLEGHENQHRLHSLFLDSLFRVVELTK